MTDNKELRGQNLPIPDPTVFTTEAVERSAKALREVIEAEIDGLKKVMEERFSAMDKANALLQHIADGRNKIVDEKVLHLRELQDEKLTGVQTQFAERDTRTETSSRDAKVAVDAAFSAQKEAVNEQNKSTALSVAKSETSTNKQIEQLGLLIASTAKATDDKISDIKDRLTVMESVDRGAKSANKESFDHSRANIAMVISAMVAVLTVISFFLRNMP